MPARIDVGVVTWNTAELTVSALRHLLEHDQGCDIRILVHDNGSSDGTADAVARFVPEAEVEACPDNLGFARGMNRLIGRSQAPWFFALNSDAWPERGALRKLVEVAEQSPQSAAVAPRLLRPDDTVEHSTHPFPSLKVAAIDALGGRHWLPEPMLEDLCLEGAWHHDKPRFVDWAVGAALLMRRDAISQIGGFDERFFMYVEDLEWCWRAGRAGWRIRFEPTAVVRHIGNASGEKRWGSRRLGLEASNLRALLPELMGRRRALSYRALQAVACAGQMGTARLRRSQGEAHVWRRQMKAHLGLESPPPLGGSDLSENTQAPLDVRTVCDSPAVSVVVPTCGRADLLSRLFAALEAQTFDSRSYEVVIVDDGSPDDTSSVLEKLAADTGFQVRLLRNSKRSGPAAARNLGWRSTGTALIAFTDDDCVPGPDWLRAGVEAFEGKARMVVGPTLPPDDQRALLGQPYSRSVVVESPRFFETCNIFYRRRDLEAVGGFDERFRRPSGEDTHLALAMLELGVEPHFAPEALVRHDVRSGSLPEALRETLRWVDLPLVVKGRPWVRPSLLQRWIFWRPSHPSAIAALLGLAVGLRWRFGFLLVVPWLRHRLLVSPVGDDLEERLVALPGMFVLDVCEVAVMVRGSIRHRTILL